MYRHTRQPGGNKQESAKQKLSTILSVTPGHWYNITYGYIHKQIDPINRFPHKFTTFAIRYPINNDKKPTQLQPTNRQHPI